jgi:amidohydrolase
MSLDELLARARELRHELHRHPELAHREHRTANRVREALGSLGIPWRACAGTGTVAVLAPDAPGRCRALRADLDALPLTESSGVPWSSEHPGVMHACGHDGHTASLVAAAELLKSRERELPGRVVLLFQPAEEGGHGGRQMVAEGALEGVDEVYGWHNWPPLPLGTVACPDGPVMAANGEWRALIEGRGGHASQPHQTIDPIAAGAAFVTLVQQVVARQVAPTDAAVVSVTCFHAGTADNIIPDSAELVGTVRAATTTLRDELARRTEAVLTAACAVAGARASWDYHPTYPATVNDPACAAIARAASRRILGEHCLITNGLPIMAAEDFAYYLDARPGAYLLLGAGRPGQRLEPCHSPRFDFADELIPIALRLWSELAGLPAAIA